MATLVQQNANTTNDGTPDTLAFSSNVTGGNLLVCLVQFRDQTAQVTGVTSSNNGTWTLATARVGVAIYYKANATAGADTVSVAFNAPSNQTTYIQVAEFSGLATSSALDQSNNQSNTGSTTVTFPALTTTGAGLIVAAASFSGSATVSGLQSGYVAFGYTPNPGREFSQYKISSGAETTSSNATLDGTWSSNAAIANFLDAVASGQPTGSRYRGVPGMNSISSRFGRGW